MSKASEFAGQVLVLEPTRFEGEQSDDGRYTLAYVDNFGNAVIQDADDDEVIIDACDAVGVARWLLDTFGTPEDKYTIR